MTRRITIIKAGEKVNKRRWFGVCELCKCQISLPKNKRDKGAATLLIPCPTNNCGCDIPCSLLEVDETGKYPKHGFS